MECRAGCAACCIVISISSPIPGMQDGKPAGVPCVQLTEDRRCRLFGKPERPAVCGGFMPDREMCGDSDEEAFRILAELERATQPAANRQTEPARAESADRPAAANVENHPSTWREPH